jgi:hypothetical protein
MLLVLFLLTAPDSLGIGVGLYPSGAFSLRHYLTERAVLQFTFGNFLFEFDDKKFVSTTAGGMRVSYQIAKQEGNYQPTDPSSPKFKACHFIGGGIGLHFIKPSTVFAFEAFYELEFFPIVEVFPISVGIGAGISGAGQKAEVGPFPALHIYIINLKFK